MEIVTGVILTAQNYMTQMILFTVTTTTLQEKRVKNL